MTIAHVLALLITGVVAGFASGLLGIGGGFIMTPVQFMVFTNMGAPTDIAIRLAFGTDLLVMLPTAISGTWRHHKQKAVYWKAALVMGTCSLIGGLGGATLAAHLPGQALRMAFGGLIIASGIRMLTAKSVLIEEEPKHNPWLWAAWGLPIGIISGVLGIGGGVLAIPVLTLALRFRMHHAIATSLAMMIFTSIGGIIGYIVNGIGVPNLPPYSLGYVNLRSWFLLIISTVGMAQIGAITTHRLPAKQLRYIFISLIFFMGLKMLGVFDWLGQPI